MIPSDGQSGTSSDQDGGSSLLGLWIFLGLLGGFIFILICISVIVIIVVMLVKQLGKAEAE